MIRGLIGRDGQPFATYLLIGGTSVLTEWSAFWVLLKTPLHYMAAAIAFTVATCDNCLSACKRSSHQRLVQAGEILPWSEMLPWSMRRVCSPIAINTLVMVELIRDFGIGLMASKIAGTDAAFQFNFTSHRFLIFGRRPPAPVRIT